MLLENFLYDVLNVRACCYLSPPQSEENVNAIVSFVRLFVHLFAG